MKHGIRSFSYIIFYPLLLRARRYKNLDLYRQRKYKKISYFSIFMRTSSIFVAFRCKIVNR